MGKSLLFKTIFAENQKAKRFVRNFYKEHGEMPTDAQINDAKALTEEEMAKIQFNDAISEAVAASGGESVGVWDYIWNEDTWNGAYNKENSPLKEYLDLYPDEDRWNFNENRPAQARDKVDGQWPDYCPQCWKGAVGAPGSAYPWCVVNITPFAGTIKFNYDGGEDVFPWGAETRLFKKSFAIASIPTELGMQYKLDDEGHTTFEPEKLAVTIVRE